LPDNPANETPEGDPHTFNVRYQVERAAHACRCSHRNSCERRRQSARCHTSSLRIRERNFSPAPVW